MNRELTIPKPPLHPLSSAVTLALDAIFGFSESIMPFSLPITMAVVFCACTISVTLIEKNIAHDSLGAAFAKGFAMGILAGLPYPVMGTAAGTIFLGWSGLSRLEEGLRRLRGPSDKS